MNLFALIILAAGSCQVATGQSLPWGKIVYEDKVKLEIRPDGEEAQFAESLPKERILTKMLLFNSDYSLYQQDESKKNEAVLQISHSGVRRMVFVGNDKTFTDLKNKRKVEQKDFMTRLFLIESDIGNTVWKLTGNTRLILDYTCLEAVTEVKDKKIRAWFTSSIPVSAGPAGYGDLPGLVLKVDINDGKQTITATVIDLKFNDFGSLVRPREGKKVTSEEYNKIVEEKTKEIESEGMKNGGSALIRANN